MQAQDESNPADAANMAENVCFSVAFFCFCYALRRLLRFPPVLLGVRTAQRQRRAMSKRYLQTKYILIALPFPV